MLSTAHTPDWPPHTCFMWPSARGGGGGGGEENDKDDDDDEKEKGGGVEG